MLDIYSDGEGIISSTQFFLAMYRLLFEPREDDDRNRKLQSQNRIFESIGDIDAVSCGGGLRWNNMFRLFSFNVE